ncbi:acetate--CoA ligase [Ameyamaea chiangmaiensis]|uniref:Acetate--CoA ligase n=1 Tax=Ameyamaea chiangmaiensis TaxID=442969 RepID=A0A850PDJ1_9PROT|nr:acetate--CoA ligase [Ameyamaea chiangmaiensis]NVN40749.1 acetate--CoA ligase [Ameyamaea chiangmaiensis]
MASAWKADAATFWMQQSARLLWREAPTQAQAGDFTGTAHVTWFADGRLNPTESCLDRHAAARPDACALIWEGQDGRTIRLSWADLLQRVCRMANALREAGVAKGDRVALHLPAVVESVVAMLACARIGAVHMVLFGGFSAEGLADRLDDGTPVLVVTADEARRGAKIIPMKRTMDDALSRATGDSVRTVLVLAVTGADVPMTAGRDRALGPLLDGADTACAPAILAAEDPLFVLYTSGSTGKPKGLVHVAGGYMVWASLTHEVAFGCGSEDVFWCTADTSWITGHTYVVYGPLANGTTVLMYEGLPSWPTPGRWWDVIDRHGVTVFYTSPTAIRAMKAEGNDILEARGLDSLRVLGSVGEPIGEDAWTWFHDHVGKGRCPVVDTWWQTETGGIMIAPAAGAVAPRPGVATRPLPGVEAVLLDAAGVPVVGEGEGNLCLAASWPGQARTIWGSHDRFVATYFATYPGHYFTGDAARREADGYFRITGRVDDVVNVSGHRIGTAEIESAVMRGEGVVECAAIGVPHGLKGEGLVVFAVVQPGGAGEAALKALVADAIGRYAVPEAVYLVADLPKTRSGKIVRRLLRKIAAREIDALGDLSTLADPDAVGRIIAVVQGGG